MRAVGVEQGVAVIDRIGLALAVLLALSASSPFIVPGGVHQRRWARENDSLGAMLLRLAGRTTS